jgi:hypothetical protein
MNRFDSLRTRLFAATFLAVVLVIGLSLAIGVVLTRREAERATLRGVANQADILAARERNALLPFARIDAMRPALARQGESIVNAPLTGTSIWLPSDEATRVRHGERVQGTITVDGKRYFYAARLVGHRALVLLRPTRLGATASKPFLEGLLVAALAGAALAALASFLVARAIARPVSRRVVEDREQPRAQVRPGPEAVGRAERLQIRVLHEILGVGRVMRQSQRRAVQAVDRRQCLGLERGRHRF